MSPIDLNQETPLALSEVPDRLPKRNGKKVHYSTVYRWATKGARGRVLESRLIGGVRYTTLGALRRFCEAGLTEASEPRVAEALRRVLYGE